MRLLCDTDKDQRAAPFDQASLAAHVTRILQHGWGRIEIVIKNGAIDAVYCTEVHRPITE